MSNATIKTAIVMALVYSAKDACTALGISRCTLWKYAKSGQIKTCKIGRRICFPVADLQLFVSNGGTASN